MTAGAPHWTGRAGAWVGIGASPAALVLGAQLADRHDGPLALGAVVLAVVGMMTLLTWQGRLGLVRPAGEDGPFGLVVSRYFRSRAVPVISLVLAAAMVGWTGFNAGLGGAALAELAGVSNLVTTPALAALVGLMAVAGLRWWNWAALAATAASLLLTAVVVASVEPSASPVAAGVPAPSRLLSDVAALVGYVSVFALRAPDFTAGLTRVADVVWPAALLVGITVCVAAAGVAVWSASGDPDVIEVISGRVATGNALLVVAVVPAMLTSLHSGVLALTTGLRVPGRAAHAVVATAGIVLGMVRFDRHLVLWLSTLSAVLVPVMVPLAVEVVRRRRGRPQRRVGTWTWASGSAVGAVGTAAGWHLALPAAVATAAVATAAGRAAGRAPSEEEPCPVPT